MYGSFYSQQIDILTLAHVSHSRAAEEPCTGTIAAIAFSQSGYLLLATVARD